MAYDVSRRPAVTLDLRKPNRKRRRDYFDWAKQVTDGMRGTNRRLEAAFDAAYARRPRLKVRKSR